MVKVEHVGRIVNAAILAWVLFLVQIQHASLSLTLGDISPVHIFTMYLRIFRIVLAGPGSVALSTHGL